MIIYIYICVCFVCFSNVSGSIKFRPKLPKAVSGRPFPHPSLQIQYVSGIVQQLKFDSEGLISAMSQWVSLLEAIYLDLRYILRPLVAAARSCPILILGLDHSWLPLCSTSLPSSSMFFGVSRCSPSLASCGASPMAVICHGWCHCLDGFPSSDCVQNPGIVWKLGTLGKIHGLSYICQLTMWGVGLSHFQIHPSRRVPPYIHAHTF